MMTAQLRLHAVLLIHHIAFLGMTEVQQTRDDSESSEESAAEIDASGSETSDDEIQCRMPSKENDENKPKKVSKEKYVTSYFSFETKAC